MNTPNFDPCAAFGHAWKPIHKGYLITTWQDQEILVLVSRRTHGHDGYRIERCHRTTLELLELCEMVTELPSDLVNHSALR